MSLLNGIFYGTFPKKQGIAIKKQEVSSPQIFSRAWGGTKDKHC